MIEFKSYASSSKANMYTVDDGTTKVMVECGLSWKEVRKALNFQTSTIAGLCLTHQHKDHSRSASEAIRAGIDVWMSPGCAEALNLSGHRLHTVKAKEQFEIDTWTVLPFDTRHDDLDSLGYLLVNREGEKLLFVSDSFYVPYRFEGLTVIAIECNYALDILNANVASGTVDRELKKRIMRSHASLSTVKDFLRANDLSQVESIHLIHLSDQNSDAERFRREVMELTGKPTYIC